MPPAPQQVPRMPLWPWEAATPSSSMQKEDALLCHLWPLSEYLLCASDSIMSPKMVTCFRMLLPKCDRQDISGIYGISRLHLPLCRAQPRSLWQASLTLSYAQRQAGGYVGRAAHLSGTSSQTSRTLAWHFACHFIIPQFPNLGDQHPPPHLFTPYSQDV